MTESDIPFGLSLGEIAGWNQLPADWLRIYQYEPEGCFVAMVDQTPVATITTTTYGKKLAWIGMMLVHPDFRRQGIATQLMQHAITYLESKNIECIKLDATPAGAKVYEHLGFQAEWEFQRYERKGTETEFSSDRSHTHFTPPEFDTQSFGVERQQLLTMFAGDSNLITTSNGFGMVRPGRLATYLGPVISTSAEDAQEFIGALLKNQKKTIFWDAPGPNANAVSLTQKFGFQPTRPLIRMWRGKTLIQGDVNQQYALASPATG